MLEAGDRVVRVTDDDHLTRRMALPPLTDPQIIVNSLPTVTPLSRPIPTPLNEWTYPRSA